MRRRPAWSASPSRSTARRRARGSSTPGPSSASCATARTEVPEREALIKRAQCQALAGYLRSDRERPDRGTVVAVHILSHEARHMAGTTNEAEAECEAMQRDAWTARLLGASPAQAQALAATYWRDVFPHVSDAYRSSACTPGGSMDEHLQGSPLVRVRRGSGFSAASR